MNKMHILDLDTMQWKNGPDMPMARSFHGCNLVTDGQGKKKIVVMGGSPKLWGDGDHQDTVDIYDVETGVWKAGMGKSSWHSVLALRHHIYIYSSRK